MADCHRSPHTTEQAARVKMALAEAGYPDAAVRLADGCVQVALGTADLRAMWKAGLVVGIGNRCWACFQRTSESDGTCLMPGVEDCGVTEYSDSNQSRGAEHGTVG